MTEPNEEWHQMGATIDGVNKTTIITRDGIELAVYDRALTSEEVSAEYKRLVAEIAAND